ncbi:hypothetical protein H671_1g2658 [Cricetulus griseus]|uniref:Uncharacterized protein n=1 Tax=Cricetulus griseus TaxID=10029 RepID=A0A061IJR7_CRIGR|nr:hypothetical protein H671_1g2658 [Cricetulus griseus]
MELCLLLGVTEDCIQLWPMWLTQQGKSYPRVSLVPYILAFLKTPTDLMPFGFWTHGDSSDELVYGGKVAENKRQNGLYPLAEKVSLHREWAMNEKKLCIRNYQDRNLGTTMKQFCKGGLNSSTLAAFPKQRVQSDWIYVEVYVPHGRNDYHGNRNLAKLDHLCLGYETAIKDVSQEAAEEIGILNQL